MNENTANYLQRYIDHLDRITHQDQVYAELSDWHFATKPELGAAVHDLNESLPLSGAYRLRPHIATTAIGRLDREFVVVSANPGYSDKTLARNPGGQSKNDREDAYRSASPQQNAGFCRHFFDRYRDQCGGSSPYWTSVMRLLDIVEGGNGREQGASSEAMWRAATQADILGGIDLLPFHSTRDAITPYLYGKRTQRMLRETALATLAMALRLKPKFILITSRPGQELMRDLMTDLSGRQGSALDIAACHAGELEAPYNRILAWQVNDGATRVITFPYQIFSGSFRAKKANYTHAGFADALQRLVCS